VRVLGVSGELQNGLDIIGRRHDEARLVRFLKVSVTLACFPHPRTHSRPRGHYDSFCGDDGLLAMTFNRLPDVHIAWRDYGSKRTEMHRRDSVLFGAGIFERCFLPRNLYPTSSPSGSGRAFSAESLGKGLGTIPA
jgi:hypothetical protein